MWRLWLFLALIGLLIWGFARLQQRNANGRNGADELMPPDDDPGSDGADKISKDKSNDDK